MGHRYYSQEVELEVGPSLRRAWNHVISRGETYTGLVERAIRNMTHDAESEADIVSRIMFLVAGYEYLGDRNILEGALATEMLRRRAQEWSVSQHAVEGGIRQGEIVGIFLRSGCRVYEVSDALAKRLAATDVRGVPSVLAKLPFRSIAMRVPALFGDSELLISEIPSEPLPAGVVNVMQREDGTWDPKTIDQDLSEEWSKGVTVRTLQIAMISAGDAFIREGMNARPKGWTATVLLPAKLTVEECLDKVRKDVDERTATAVKFALNLALYLSWPDTGDPMPEVVSDKYKDLQSRLKRLPKGNKRERVKDQLKSISPERRILVGSHLAGVELGGEGIPVTVRTLVAGHWKQQPFGPARAERKLIRIEPYWRGPLDAVESRPIRVAK